MRCSASLPCLALLAACSVGPEAHELGVELPPAVLVPADFPGAAAMLAGFDAADDASWTAGDEVLFALQLTRDGVARRWLLHLRLTEPLAIARDGAAGAAREALAPLQWSLGVNGVDTEFASAPCRVLATVCDADGNVLGRSEPVLPRDFLARGFTAACERVAQRARRDGHGIAGFYRDDDVAPFAAATVAAIALLQVVQQDDVLAPLLWEVIEKPSFWSVVRGLGARVTLRPSFHLAQRATWSVAGAMPWRVPLALLVNDEEALQSDLFVEPSARPLALCGGIVAVQARHPREPGRVFAVQLLAAHCGGRR